MVVLVSVISSFLYVGWSWIDLFFILIMYAGIVSTEKEIQKEEQRRENAAHVSADAPKVEKRKTSRATKVAFILFSIASLISAILNYFQLVNL
ncbi:hypothetical protein PIPA1_26820 [Pelosinus sp. IPA-1]|nr:hypothetical protein PIPA1_26820 [Pelosinus sp. IPA-1]